MTTPRPDLADLDLLVMVAEKGSISRAAMALGLAQPSVSRRISVLERTLHLRLLERSAHGSTLTPAGRIVVDWAFSLLLAADDFSRSIEALHEARGPAVRVAVSMTIAEHYAPTWLAVARRKAPGTTVALSIANSTQVADLVEGKSVDLGLVESPSIRPSLHSRQIGEDDLVVAVAPGHPWAERNSIPAAELAQARLLVREKGSGTRKTIEEAFRAHGLELRTELELASNTALKSAAIEGIGPVVLSALAVAHEVEHGQLVKVAVHDLRLSRPLSVIWKGEAGVPESARAFLEAVTRGR